VREHVFEPATLFTRSAFLIFGPGESERVPSPEAAEVLRLLLSYLLKRTFSLSLKPLVLPADCD
jgi:hypothetical protein